MYRYIQICTGMYRRGKPLGKYLKYMGISFLKTVNTLHIHWYSDNPARTDMSYGAPCRHKGGPLGRWPRTLAA